LKQHQSDEIVTRKNRKRKKKRKNKKKGRKRMLKTA
jgi:hypothetical protein